MNISQATLDFIEDHAREDVRKLALSTHLSGEVDIPFALEQIAGRQTAVRKLPSWAKTEGLLFPPHLSMEQCSSEQTALYKQRLVQRLGIAKERFADLTGGFGVDFSFLAPLFQKAWYVERQPKLCEMASHNFPLLGLDNARIVQTESEAFLRTMLKVDLLFLDPARRDTHGMRTYAMEDCTPNVPALLPLLIERSNAILLKLSPMLDWRKAVFSLEKEKTCQVTEVHIVSVGNECKELLLYVTHSTEVPESRTIFAVNDQTIVAYKEEENTVITHSTPVANPAYLYEPNASLMKAGAFQVIAQRYQVAPISSLSHLFVSQTPIQHFPGRSFHILASTSFNKKELRTALKGMEKANISVRNFPLTVAALRKKLKLKEGGDTFLFATTLSDGSHRLFICKKY